MNTRDFAYWLNGYFELVESELSEEEKKHLELSAKQVQKIKNHLNLVFLHDLDPKSNKESGLVPAFLQKTHDGDNPNLKVRC